MREAPLLAQERMRAKAEAVHKTKMEQQNTNANATACAPTQQAISEEELLKIFSAEEKAERTPRGAKPQVQSNSEGKKKKKGNK